ncbi:MAG TPA: DoxX family protein [Xanthobacteraceae bacterium]|jgi:putative oxidoreductase|nr:DoxX family protein [Xanthobacteraceae bacterium]
MRENAVSGGITIAGAAAEQAVSPTAVRGGVVDTLVWLCARAAYALLALGLRVVMARVFFLSGQARIEGPGVPIRWPAGGVDLAVTLPANIKETTFQLFETKYPDLPIAPATAAYLFSYAEFVLPICLLLGFATRFAAAGLLALTMLLQIYIAPALWWPLHVYWVSILLVLALFGPGAISIDALIRTIYRRDRHLAGG